MIARVSNTKNNIAKACVYLGKESALIDDGIIGIKHNQNPKYLAYALSTTDAQKQKIKLSKAAGICTITFDLIKKIKIPIPSLEKQEEIVNLLDKFSELSKELEKELNLRKQQYEYYRDELLSFKQDNKIKWLTLGEITIDFYKGHYFSKNTLLNQGDPCIRYTQLYDENRLYFDFCTLFTDKSKIQKPKYCQYGDLLITATSRNMEGIAKVCVYLGKEPALIDSECLVIKHKQNPKYLTYALSTNNFRKKIKLSSSACLLHIVFDSIKAIKIPLPSLERQAEIVNLLDKFWKLSSDIKDGLPKEILLRKQQYEYYRDKLLKFEVLKV